MKVTKTEHNGAKNGGGAWCTREEAKTLSRKTRRNNDRKAVRGYCRPCGGEGFFSVQSGTCPYCDGTGRE